HEHELAVQKVVGGEWLTLWANAPAIDVHAALLKHTAHVGLAREKRLRADQGGFQNVVSRKLVLSFNREDRNLELEGQQRIARQRFRVRASKQKARNFLGGRQSLVAVDATRH